MTLFLNQLSYIVIKGCWYWIKNEVNLRILDILKTLQMCICTF